MNDVTKVRWLPVPGYEGLYEVSSIGQVRSFVGQRKFRETGRILKPIRRKIGGYLQVTLCQPGKKTVFQIHALVLMAFVGPRPVGQQGCHGDGDPSNNALCNLRWGTPLENRLDCIRHGTQPMGAKHGAAKLNEAQVSVIRASTSTDTARLAKELRVSRNTITRIRSGVRWSSIGARRQAQIDAGSLGVMHEAKKDAA